MFPRGYVRQKKLGGQLSPAKLDNLVFLARVANPTACAVGCWLIILCLDSTLTAEAINALIESV